MQMKQTDLQKASTKCKQQTHRM